MYKLYIKGDRVLSCYSTRLCKLYIQTCFPFFLVGVEFYYFLDPCCYSKVAFLYSWHVTSFSRRAWGLRFGSHCYPVIQRQGRRFCVIAVAPELNGMARTFSIVRFATVNSLVHPWRSSLLFESFSFWCFSPLLIFPSFCLSVESGKKSDTFFRFVWDAIKEKLWSWLLVKYNFCSYAIQFRISKCILIWQTNTGQRFVHLFSRWG